MNNEILDFIVPQYEPLQLFFFILILAMFFGSCISTYLNAKDTSWEKNWNNGTPEDRSDDLDIDHGSVTDLWHAVATKSEKLAEIMPGMLLVVGLLGTFLGLGLALNHASNLLGNSNALSASGTANSMQELMNMMQGLGTKFKTSTWGITFFLLLKVWSSSWGYEEKRLAWVIRKVKVELEFRKIKAQEREASKQQALFSQIIEASQCIVQSFTQNVAQLTESQKAQHEQTVQYMQGGSAEIKQALEQSIQGVREDLTGINTAMQSSTATMTQVLEKSTQGVCECLADINTAIQSSSVEMKQVLEQSTQGLREDLTGINTAMQSGSATMRQALEQSTQIVHQDLAGIYAATQVSSQAMSGFVDSTKTIIQDMSAASNKMADGAHQVGMAGSSLVKAVDDFSTQFTQVLGDVRTDLSTAINDMSEQAALTLEQGTKELGKATLEISTALGVLSQDVTTTMNGVKEAIEKSLKIQQEGAVLFRRSSDTLNENVTATTGLVQKLGEDISSGLQAVSDSGRRMASIGKSLETIIPQMGDLLPALEPLKTMHIQQQSLSNEIKALRADLLELNSHQELNSIGKTIENSLKVQLEKAEQLQQSTDKLNENIADTFKLFQKLSEEIHSRFESSPVQHQSLINVIQGIRLDLQSQSFRSIPTENQIKTDSESHP